MRRIDELDYQMFLALFLQVLVHWYEYQIPFYMHRIDLKSMIDFVLMMSDVMIDWLSKDTTLCIHNDIKK